MEPFTVQTVSHVILKLLHEPYAGLLSGIIFGTKATLSKQLTTDLITTGTIHIAALSGMNISILAAFINVLLLRVAGRRLSSLLTVFIIIGFGLFVGPSASIVRAGIMGCLALVAVILGRQSWALLSFLLTVAIMLVLHPLWLGDVSFQLSALATLGLILFGGSGSRPEAKEYALEHNSSLNLSNKSPFTQKILAWIWNLVEDDLHLTLAAQSLTLPVIFFTFHRLSLIAPLTNVLIGWTIGPLTVLGLVTGFLGYLWWPLGVLPSLAAWVLLEYLIRVVTFTAGIPFASIRF